LLNASRVRLVHFAWPQPVKSRLTTQELVWSSTASASDTRAGAQHLGLVEQVLHGARPRRETACWFSSEIDAGGRLSSWAQVIVGTLNCICAAAPRSPAGSVPNGLSFSASDGSADQVGRAFSLLAAVPGGGADLLLDGLALLLDARRHRPRLALGAAALARPTASEGGAGARRRGHAALPAARRGEQPSRLRGGAARRRSDGASPPAGAGSLPDGPGSAAGGRVAARRCRRRLEHLAEAQLGAADVVRSRFSPGRR
jgi:hypothetical protein